MPEQRKRSPANPAPDLGERNARDNLAQASWCCRCRQWLPVDDFGPRLKLGGVESWCRRCHADANRRWREENSDAVDAYNARRRAEYREAHPLPTRRCIVCRKEMTKRPNALVCGRECRRQRKIEQRRRLRDTA